MFAHLLQLQRRHGKDNFPLIEQTYFPNARELVSQYLYFVCLLVCFIFSRKFRYEENACLDLHFTLMVSTKGLITKAN